MRQRGLTLIEVLVALALMAWVSAVSWRGLDSLMRTREHTQAQVNRVAAVQVGLAQWRADLEAIQTVKDIHTSGLDWNGQVLRIMRAVPPTTPGAPTGLSVCAWTLRDGQWLRWQSSPTLARDELARAWLQAQRWAQDPSAQDRLQQVQIAPAQSWQIFYFRENSWSNPLSSAGTSNSTAAGSSAGSAAASGLNGPITLDWVRPNFGNVKS